MSGLPFFNPFAAPIFPQQAYPEFRRSDNIEDRRKEKFLSNPQQPQMPNVFGDPISGPQNMTGLNKHTDYEPQPQQPDQLSTDAGAGILDALIEQYLAARR